jgi:hypothetical protein
MSEKKEKKLQPHEEVLKQFEERSELLKAYEFTLNHRGYQFIEQSRSELEEKLGSPEKTKEYLSTEKGQLEYATIAAKKIQEYIIKDFKIDKSKFTSSELEKITNKMYRVNEKKIGEFAREFGPEIDFSKYKAKFLEKHIKAVREEAINSFVMDYDSKHTPAVLNHITDGNLNEFFKNNLIDELKKNDPLHKAELWNAYQFWKKGANPVGLNYLSQTERLSFFLKDEHKPKDAYSKTKDLYTVE